MLIWEENDLAAVDAAALDALAGRPTLVVVHGGPGSGRTSFLAAVRERADAAAAGAGTPFAHWSAGGVIKTAVPFRGLRDLGVLVDGVDGTTRSALQADGDLLEAIDDAVHVGPLLVAVDDLQWVDPESVEALVRTLRAVVAERLLVVVAVGYFEPFQHLPWQDFVNTDDRATRIELGGLSLETAMTVARDLRPAVRDALVERLWSHTRGNPLFLTSLLRRNEPADLERMLQLPAPAEYARAIEVRLATLGHDAVDLARAAAVIGVGWMPLAEAAYVAGLPDPTRALEILVLEFILEERMTELGTEVRIVHAVIQASVYQHIPAAERVRLHTSAAEAASDEPGELRHRYSAASTYDADLADRLEAAAATQREEHSHRMAAQYLDWASRITADGALRSRRWTDSHHERILAGSIEYVRDQLPEIRSARDRAGAALVQGALQVVDNEWLDAVRTLRPFADSGSDDLRSYRIEVLLAWASMAAGEPTAVAIAPLERAEAMSRRDDGLAGLATITAAMLDRRQDRVRQLQERLGRLPDRPAAVPLDDTYWLAWRGFSAVLYGRVQDAIGPLREVDDRMSTGMMDVGDGLTHAFLGFGYWLSGAPELATMQFRTAEALLRPRPNPMTAAYIAFGYVTAGDHARAVELLTAARTTLRDMPWDEAVNVLLMGSVADLHAFGSDAERAALMPGLRRDFGAKADHPNGAVSPMWKLHAALAHCWAGELEAAEVLAASLDATPDLAWGPGASGWVRGLVAERRGDPAALRLLTAALEAGTAPLPIFCAHIAADLARVAEAAGDSTTSARAGDAAVASYRAVGAVPYLAPAAAVTGAPPLTDGAVPDPAPGGGGAGTLTAVPAVFAVLSERERDVAALVVRGMSYAQIARELFITRSTVGFHLSRIYAKTGTSTRHELSELIRQR